MGKAARDGVRGINMITILKLVAAAGIAWGVLNPSFAPRVADADCACKADASATQFAPKAEDCSCKADVD